MRIIMLTTHFGQIYIPIDKISGIVVRLDSNGEKETCIFTVCSTEHTVTESVEEIVRKIQSVADEFICNNCICNN